MKSSNGLATRFFESPEESFMAIVEHVKNVSGGDGEADYEGGGMSEGRCL